MTIGENIREIRKQKQLTLKYVAEKTNLSIPFLSQLETNKSDATMATIRLIADALGIHPSQFFYEQTSVAEVGYKSNTNFHYEQLTNIEESSFIPSRVKLEPGNVKVDSVRHEGFEFVYCLKGTLTLTVENQSFEISVGQSHMYDATKDHYWYNYTDSEVEFLVVNERGGEKHE